MQLRDPALLHIQVPGGSKAVKKFNVTGFAIPAEGALATETAKYLAFLLHTAINRPKEERIWEDWIFAALGSVETFDIRNITCLANPIPKRKSAEHGKMSGRADCQRLPDSESWLSYAEVADSALQSIMAQNLRLKTACPFRRTGRKPTFTKDKLSLCCSFGFPWEHRSRHYSSNCRGSCASHQQQGALGWKIVFDGETTWQPNFIDVFTHFFFGISILVWRSQ